MRELEKKFSGKHVVFIAQRRILPKPTRKANKLKQKRPRSRTLMAVHNSILDDLVYPAEIVGKRIRIRLDGSRLFKVKGIHWHLTNTFKYSFEIVLNIIYEIFLFSGSFGQDPADQY